MDGAESSSESEMEVDEESEEETSRKVNLLLLMGRPNNLSETNPHASLKHSVSLNLPFLTFFRLHRSRRDKWHPRRPRRRGKKMMSMQAPLTPMNQVGIKLFLYWNALLRQGKESYCSKRKVKALRVLNHFSHNFKHLRQGDGQVKMRGGGVGGWNRKLKNDSWDQRGT